MSRQTGSYLRSCAGKVRIETEEEAHQNIAGLTRRRGWNGAMNAYLCRYCGTWHIGHAREERHDHRTPRP